MSARSRRQSSLQSERREVQVSRKNICFVITLTAQGTSTSLGLWGRGVCGDETNPLFLQGNSWRNQTAFKVFSVR